GGEVQPGPDDAETTIDLQQTYYPTPERPGSFGVRQSYQLPDSLVELEVTLPDGATALDARGFDRLDTRTFAWDGRTRQPTLIYRTPANRTIDRTDPIATTGRYVFADTGDWGIVARPPTSHHWRSRGEPVGFNRSTRVDGVGVASDVIAVFGDYRQYTRNANGQTIQLVIPASAELEADADAILASLTDAAGRLRVGDRDERVFVVAAPTDVDWGVRGLQTGPADLWVQADEPLATADNVWLHEYVHTRQAFALEPSLRWYREASAVYYAALITLEQRRIGYEAFRERLAMGARERYTDVRLTAPTSWRYTHGNYYVGPLVAGALDGQLRQATGRFTTVFRALNDHEEPIDNEAFLSMLEAAGNRSVREAGRRYTETTERPTLWTRETFQRVFDIDPERITYTIAAIRVNGSAVTPNETISVGPNATVEIDVRVANEGDLPGTYRETIFADGRAIDRLAGTLDAGETVTHTVAYRAPATGTATIEADTAHVTIAVQPSEPAPTSPTQPGFGLLGAVIALLIVFSRVRRR
ncbi:MAG: hypothetical protein ACLFR6_06140, partial [Salinarchaeum sp.]